jgi:hypothetical protein
VEPDFLSVFRGFIDNNFGYGLIKSLLEEWPEIAGIIIQNKLYRREKSIFFSEI